MTYIEQLKQRERKMARKIYILFGLIALYFYVGVQIGVMVR